MKNIIQQQVEAYPLKDESLRPVLQEFATFGFSLASKELEEKEKAVKYAEKVAYETSKKNADMIQEIERLKGLIEKAYDTGYADYDDVINSVRNHWTNFKAENNL